MKIVLYGASGMIGSRILSELLSRSHDVTAVVRNPSAIDRPGVAVRAGNVLDPQSIIDTARGADAVISAYAAPHDSVDKLVDAAHSLISGLKQAGVSRLLVVGGAGSLEVAPGVRLVDTPDFPPAWKAVALAAGDALNVYRQADLDWTYLSPAAIIEPGERTGKFRTASDTLVTDANGNSRISAEDFAIAIVDELEQPRHIRRRFTVGY